MRRRARRVGLDAAVVVVELHEHGIHRHGTVQHWVVSGVRIRALRCGCQVERLGRIGVHQVAKLVCKGGGVGNCGFKVEVEAVDGGRAEWTERGGARLLGAEGGPDLVGGCDSVVGRAKASFGVGGAADGEENGFTVGLLAGCDIGAGRRMSALSLI